MLQTIIFSKNRAMQLDLLVRSVERFAPWLPFTVLYTFTTERFEQGYVELNRRRWVEWRKERVFKTDLLQLVAPSIPYTMFLCDDDVFLRPWDAFRGLSDTEVSLSLRLSPYVTYSMISGKHVSPPVMDYEFRFAWRGADADFGCPMSVDGHVFRTDDILPLLKSLDYDGPNVLEARLAETPIERPLMRCFASSVIMNMPLNQVQSYRWLPNKNISPVLFNEFYLNGHEIDLDKIAFRQNKSVHEIADINFILKK